MNNKIQSSHLLLTGILRCAHDNPERDLIEIAIANQDLVKSINTNISRKTCSKSIQKQR